MLTCTPKWQFERNLMQEYNRRSDPVNQRRRVSDQPKHDFQALKCTNIRLFFVLTWQVDKNNRRTTNCEDKQM